MIRQQTFRSAPMLTLNDLPDINRIVALDAETTGHRIMSLTEIRKMPKGMRLPGIVIQLGCAELLRDGGTWITGRTWETLVNPDGPISPASIAVHGIRPGALKAAPRFADVRSEFEEFLGGSVLLAHAAENEIDFLNYEMRRAKLTGWEESPYHEGRFLDTQLIARDVFPGAPGNLDALCDRLWIDRSDRFEHHGALLDAMMTAEAFAKMAGGFVRDEVRSISA